MDNAYEGKVWKTNFTWGTSSELDSSGLRWRAEGGSGGVVFFPFSPISQSSWRRSLVGFGKGGGVGLATGNKFLTGAGPVVVTAGILAG